MSTRSGITNVARLREDAPRGGIHPRLSVKTLTPFLGDKEPIKRHWAADRLGRLGDPAAVPLLIQLLKDDNSSVQCGAVEALARLKDPRATLPIADLLTSTDWQVGRCSVQALGDIGDPRALEPLLAVSIGEGSPRVAKGDMPLVVAAIGNRVMGFELVAALAKVGHESSIATVLERTRSKDEMDRNDALVALGGMSDPRAAARLAEMLRDPDDALRRDAAWAAGRRSDNVLREPLGQALAKEKVARVRAAMAGALAQLGDTGALMAGLKDTDPSMREESARWANDALDAATAATVLGEAIAIERDSKVKEAMEVSLVFPRIDFDALEPLDEEYLGPISRPKP